MGAAARADAPPELPAGTEAAELQLVEEGVGPLIHRIYRTRTVGSTLDPTELMGELTVDLDRVAPSEFATFQRIGEPSETLACGDHYVVRMPGPWDGPVRVVAVGPTSFRLATLPGHLEAGQIEFRAGADYRSLWFEIESWARSGDRLSDLLYARLRISKEVQLHMWSAVRTSTPSRARSGPVATAGTSTTWSSPCPARPRVRRSREAAGRLLRISFKGLRFWVGVRIGRDYEETRQLEGRAVRVFGWSYDTLEGHFEEGRMHYELWKWLDTGEVEFHLRALSRPARKGWLPIRLGFRLFGRTQQLRFYRQVCRRVRRLTEVQMETERAARHSP